MKLTITIDLDNAAFADSGTEEIARLLADLSERLPEPLSQTSSDILLHDINGNFVGQASIA